jgi:hypothetical protein
MKNQNFKNGKKQKNEMKRKKKMKEKRKFEFLNLYKVKSLIITFSTIC